ncbi:protein DpdJ [Sulfurovum sp.]|uniref:protein DpdJ n=1 Tax=Sulfurovum sp. TaxID=1969726 RepID=UPI0035649961
MNESLQVQLLNHLEEIEYKSLQWGSVDGSLREDEVLKYADIVIEENNSGYDAADLLEDLIDEKLLFEVPSISDDEDRYRTRFGESIRLLSKLRQLFPKHKSWQEGPRLVSDFRIDRRKRNYPKREIDPRSVVGEVLQNLTNVQLNVWQALTNRPDFKLSKFQVDAIQEIMDPEFFKREKAAIITAGTGSGKTLSFYLPAFLKLSNSIQKDPSNWTRILAAYPRIELLKDQLSEAVLQSLRIDSTLKEMGLRSIKIGALYGDVPTKAENVIKYDQWEKSKVKEGRVCPFLRCPVTDDALVWLDSDIHANIERLVPEGTDPRTISLNADQIVLTRKRLVSDPPDILFVTMEMMHKRLADTAVRQAFGITKPQNKRPFMMLLDEVHTYIGVSGAQAALVLRRWKHLLRAKVAFVGLSATLTDADQFFSELTGIPKWNVREITPQSNDLIQEGAEYQTILKGDPVNRTSLLSTTIQSAMLVGRIMDPIGTIQKRKKEDKEIFYGEKTFIFTDDLDVTNRLFDNLKDAEGFNAYGRNDTYNPRSSLASLRSIDSADILRYVDGQDWRMVDQNGIGHPLDQNDHSEYVKLPVSRTSSQDRGVDSKSPLVVATASLEVGYNDPTVGVVIQHKSSYNWANFLQRKGRAGRERGMRPFMITVLSDFGRDRIAYQHYEQFFAPKVPAQRLPIENRYLLKMQAVAALLDWLSTRVNVQGAWLWDLLSCPSLDTEYQYTQKQKLELKEQVQPLLKELMTPNSPIYNEYILYLQRALKISEEIVNELMWRSPRSIILEAVPTLQRQLFSNWNFLGEKNTSEFFVKYLPLPEFLASNLFTDLALPEVEVLVPSADQYHKERKEAMPILQAMKEFVPGRISRRFATRAGNEFHWIPVDINAESQEVNLDNYMLSFNLVTTLPEELGSMRIFRPWQMQLHQVDGQTKAQISQHTNSQLEWKSTFTPFGEAHSVNIVQIKHWKKLVQDVSFFISSQNSSIDVLRYATTAQASFSFNNGNSKESELTFTHESEQVGVGFSLDVDGLLIKYTLPSTQELKCIDFPKSVINESKPAWFRYFILKTELLDKKINIFARERLQEIWLYASIITSEEENITIAEASRLLMKDFSERIERVVKDFYNTEIVQDMDDDGSERHEAKTSKLYQAISELIAMREIRNVLHNALVKAFEADSIEWWEWIRRRLHLTFAEAVLQACKQLTPNQSATDSLLVDPEDLTESTDAQIWVTESSAGGIGVLDALLTEVSRDPQALFQAITAATEPSDYELVLSSLDDFVTMIKEDNDIKNLAIDIVNTQDHHDSIEYLGKLYNMLSDRGVPVSHNFKTSLNTRILREGVSTDFFNLLKDFIEWRDDFSKEKEISLDLRLLCFIAAKNRSIVQTLSRVSGMTFDNVTQIVDVLSGIFWPNDFESRQRLLQSYNPFTQIETNDSKLLRSLIVDRHTPVVDKRKLQWKEKLFKKLSEYGQCRLVTDKSDEEYKDELHELLAIPVDVGFLQLFIVVDGINMSKNETIITLKLREEW